MNKGVRTVLSIVGMALIVLAAQFVSSMISGSAFEPNWLMVALLAVVGGLASVFGPDASQRKQNRKDLADKFRK